MSPFALNLDFVKSANFFLYEIWYNTQNIMK